MTGPSPVKVYGSQSKFRTDLLKRIRIADDLRARVDSALDLYRQRPLQDPNLTGLARLLAETPSSGDLQAVEESANRWVRGNDALIARYLGSGASEFTPPRLLPSRWSSPDQGDEARASACQALLDDDVQRLQRILDRLPQPGPTAIRPVEDRFAELRQTTLIEDSLLNSYVKRMSKTRTRTQVSEAIGAAKELVEACHRATLDLIGVTYPKGDFQKLGKLVRQEVLRREGAAPSTASAEAIGMLFTGMGTVELALATLRNEVGTGHGKPDLPKGLRPRHAQLAIDIADTHVRYLVATLLDLDLI